MSGREKNTSGRKLSDREIGLNTFKNKKPESPDARPVTLSLEDIINAPKHEDETEYTDGQYVKTTGYIVKYEEEGGESCNCYMADKSSKTGDVHIYLGLKPDADEKQCIIVEITPAFKKLHPAYEKSIQPGSKVNIFGFMLYDYMHEKNAINSCRSCGGNVWRKTCWEIHPVTYIENI